MKKELIKKSIISPYHKDFKMSIKLIELVNSVEALNKLSETKLPANVSFSLSKFLKEATNDLESYNKVKNEKIKEYGVVVLDENGKEKLSEDGNTTYSFTDESSKKYVSEMQEIENKEILLDIPEIKIKDLGDSVIEPIYLVRLSWLIKE